MSMYGAGDDCYFLAPPVPLSGVDTVTTPDPITIAFNDRAGVQLIVDPVEEDVDVADTDDYVLSTKTYTFANFDFTGLVGAVIHIADAAHAGNDGAHIVTSVSSAHVVVCSGDSGGADETFDPDTVDIYVTYPRLAGAWMIEISNDYTPDSSVGSFGEDADVAGHWTDITSAFSPAIAPVVAADAATWSQVTLATICFRALRITFTSTAGHGFPLALGELRAFS